MLLLTLRGTPTIYYGDELGMTDVPIAPDQVEDPYERRVPGLGVGRDPSAAPCSGRRKNTPASVRPAPGRGSPVADDYEDVNIASQRADSRTMLALYRRLPELRRTSPALSDGAYATVGAGEGVLAYRRDAADKQILVALNLTAEARRIALSGVIRLSTQLDRVGERVTEELILRPDEGVVLTHNE
jgi:alpha-glucosidase